MRPYVHVYVHVDVRHRSGWARGPGGPGALRVARCMISYIRRSLDYYDIDMSHAAVEYAHLREIQVTSVAWFVSR